MVPLKSEIGRGYLTALGKPKSGWELVGWKQLSHEGTLIPQVHISLFTIFPLGHGFLAFTL